MTMQSGFDISKLFQEAQSRWLKPAEVYYILQNHETCPLTLKAPQNPPSGALFLFNRRVLRFFRKDGYSWRKKKDGRTVGEAHERLKVGNVDALNCYYAHGEQNPNFQRRCYWMLDPARDHIVLVHYREITEGRPSNGSTSHSSPESFSNFSQSAEYCSAQHLGSSSGITEVYEPYQSPFSPSSVEEVSSTIVGGKNFMDRADGMDRSRGFGLPSYPVVNQVLQRLTKELSLGDDDSSMYFEKLPPDYSQSEKPHDSGFLACESELSKPDERLNLPLERKCGEEAQWIIGNDGVQDDAENMLRNSDDTVDQKESLSWKEMLELSSSSTGVNSQNQTSDGLALNGVPNPSTKGIEYEAAHHSKDATSLEHASLSIPERVNSCMDSAAQPEKLICQWQDLEGKDGTNGMDCHQTSKNNFNLELTAAKQFLLGSDDTIISPASGKFLQDSETSVHSTYSSGTSTLDTNSGMRMLKKTNSVDWMETRNISIDKYTPDYYEAWFDQESHLGTTTLEADSGLTIAQKQRFSIREISPEWAYATEGTKLIIVGDFLCDPLECAWGCMVGDIEVPIEVIQAGVILCQAPQHTPGKVTLCITSGNRESCSEVREFEYRIKPTSSALDNNLPEKDANKSTELLLLARFAQTLLLGHDSSSVQIESNVEWESNALRKPKMDDDTWGQIMEALLVGSESLSNIMDCILQELLKDKLQQWLSSKCREGEVTASSLSKEEQGIIHMIAGLGYEWALNSILDAGIGINFRDVNGWTALHWAARFGREKMVAELLAAGAFAGAVTDPTPQDPVGKNPASIAAAWGHKGLAGYLSEVALTSHLSSLTLKESEISKGSAAVEAERTVEIVSDKSIQIPNGAVEDQLSLQDSLAAVRNAALAAARIQAAFRAHSFRRRHQSADASCDEYGLTADDIHGLSAASKFHGLRDHKLNTAALSIQKKYRGWKRRKEYLTLRQNVVKIQAHVRGHQVRKKYREFLWTVGVLEKAVLRWRRKGVGLRGFRAEPGPIDESEDDDILKVFRKQKVDAAVDEAMSRVLSVVESPSARQQYRRLLESYRRAKAQSSSNNGETSSSQVNDNIENITDDEMYYFA
ncbi:calmodulin-binding transcription activator 4-like protein [Cinnamomum micranthum f. kanehirae]|uniref:Calmodulin-binding transcription activator 4-like protein n=1 Tax=Cinnamomum micranthum f. kanehirae TaxID=337451 RepID=A0A443N7N1_9MAGN|nr:calmodulin-binding transcription activator 4-like protein [Cinnamomum micranthum f. kanehirae]